MILKRYLRGLLSAALVWIGTSAARSADVEVSGYLYGEHNWTAGNVYVLTGFTYVMGGAVLNIEPGTVVKGVGGTAGANDFGTLFVCRGGKLNAIGTPNSPIIFTSTEDDVSDAEDLVFPTRGLWGGVVLLGNARLNNPASTTNNVNFDVYEGLPDTLVTNPENGQEDYLHRFGGENDDDGSGVLRYVSIRHAGKRLTTDKEVNGLSLGGVGRGTTVEYVEAYCTADDGFEFFGGSVNTKYLVSAFNDDDAFDTDQGFNGKNQFWFVIQEPGTRDEGGELNGQPSPPDVLVDGAEPRSTYEVYNATFIGAGTTGNGNDVLNIRRANFAKWHNGVFTEFQGRGILIDDTSAPEVTHNLWWALSGGAGAGHGTAFAPAELNPVADPMLRGIGREPGTLALDPIPAAGGPVFTSPRKVPSDPFYTAVAHLGAFGTENWMQDWTALGAERFVRPTRIRTLGPVDSGTPTGGLVTAVLADGKVVLTWTADGVLEVSDAFNGTYVPVPDAASPLSVEPTGGEKFYRLR